MRLHALPASALERQSRAGRRAAHAATLATAGETLWFHGQRALAYFNKDCGGRTASPAEIWPRAHALPYLPSQPDRYLHGERRQRVGFGAYARRIDRSACRAGVAAPGWQHLSVSAARRVGPRRHLAARRTRSPPRTSGWPWASRWDGTSIPSTWFEVSRQGDRFLFHGRGWGHGVGLCQKGAAAMAAQGHTTQQILAQYFPGAQAADEATGRAWQSFAGRRIHPGVARCRRRCLPARSESRARRGVAALRLECSAPFTVRAFASTPAFRDATLAPGWVAAFTEGNWIGTQPLRTLAARQLLAQPCSTSFCTRSSSRSRAAHAALAARRPGRSLERAAEPQTPQHRARAHARRDRRGARPRSPKPSPKPLIAPPVVCRAAARPLRPRPGA